MQRFFSASTGACRLVNQRLCQAQASTWSRAAATSLRHLSSTSTAHNLKQEAKDKLVEEGKKLAKDKVNQTFNAEQAKQQAKNMSSSTGRILFIGLAVAGAAYLLVGSGQSHAEEAKKPDADAKRGGDSS